MDALALRAATADDLALWLCVSVDRCRGHLSRLVDAGTVELRPVVDQAAMYQLAGPATESHRAQALARMVAAGLSDDPRQWPKGRPRPNGRPRGEFRVLLHQALADGGPGTCLDLAQRTRMGIVACRLTLADMVRAGHAKVQSTVRRAGVKRPVPVYSLVPFERQTSRAPSDTTHSGAQLGDELAAAWWGKPTATDRHRA